MANLSNVPSILSYNGEIINLNAVPIIYPKKFESKNNVKSGAFFKRYFVIYIPGKRGTGILEGTEQFDILYNYLIYHGWNGEFAFVSRDEAKSYDFA